MTTDFDQPIDRTNTDSIKWDFRHEFFGREEILPMWVADMDFETLPAVKQALHNRVEKGHFGYTKESETYFDSIAQWLSNRHQWAIQKDWIQYVPGLIPGLNFCVQAFTEPGDEVIVQSPVYKPFFTCIANNDRKIIENTLEFDGNQYEMNLNGLKDQISQRTKMLILCSPHNPVGRVWTHSELEELGQLCLDHNILMVSDEIHMDIVYPGHTHTPIASIHPSFANNTITLSSPGKTFNLQGFQTGYAIIPNENLRETFEEVMKRHGLFINNILSMQALEAAYLNGSQWVDQLLVYLGENLSFLKEFLKDQIPNIHLVEPQGTYLAWLDCRDLEMEETALNEFMINEARLGLNSGTFFGDAGTGFQRLNFACPRETLERGLNQLRDAVHHKSRQSKH